MSRIICTMALLLAGCEVDAQAKGASIVGDVADRLGSCDHLFAKGYAVDARNCYEALWYRRLVVSEDYLLPGSIR